MFNKEKKELAKLLDQLEELIDRVHNVQERLDRIEKKADERVEHPPALPPLPEPVYYPAPCYQHTYGYHGKCIRCGHIGPFYQKPWNDQITWTKTTNPTSNCPGIINNPPLTVGGITTTNSPFTVSNSENQGTYRIMSTVTSTES